MKKIICNGNYPKQLLPLVEIWAEKGRSFFLNPVNIFEHNFISMNYQGAEDVSRDLGDWSIHTEDCFLPSFFTTDDIDEIAYYFGKDLRLGFAILFIGVKCNLNCRFCLYHGDTEDKWKSKYPTHWIEVDLDVIKSRIDKLAQLGISELQVIPNGEFFVYSSWEEMLRYARSKGMVIRILFSNGTLLDETVIKKLVELGVKTLSISVNAYNFDTWKNLTGMCSKARFETALKAPVIAREMGMKTEVSIVVCRETAEEIRDFIGYWKNKCDVLKVVQEIDNSIVCSGISTVNNSFLPYYLCGDLRKRLVIGNDGRISPCCTINNIANEEICPINIDNFSVQEIEIFVDEAYKSKRYLGICRKCSSIRVPASERKKGYFHGFAGEKTGNFFFVETD